MKIMKPLHDRVVVQRLAEAEVEGMLHVPDNAREKPVQGKVLEVGPGKLLESGKIVPPAVMVGDIVVFARYGGIDIELDRGQEFLILREDEIMGKVLDIEDVEESA